MTAKQLAGSTAPDGSQYITLTDGAGNALSTLVNTTLFSPTWTTYSPVITSITGTLTTVTTTKALYLQLGKIVFIQLDFTTTTNGSGATALTFTLPVTAAAGNNGTLSGIEIVNTGVSQSGWMTGSAATFFKYDHSYPAADGSRFILTGFYVAA